MKLAFVLKFYWFRVLSIVCCSVYFMKCLISISKMLFGNPLFISVCFIFLSSLWKIVRDEDNCLALE